MTQVLYNFSSAGGFDDMFDDEVIETIFTEEVCQEFYRAPAFQEDLMDFGGGIKGLHCRAVLHRTEGSAETLLSFLSRKKNQKNLADCMEIIEQCKKALETSAYIV